MVRPSKERPCRQQGPVDRSQTTRKARVSENSDSEGCDCDMSDMSDVRKPQERRVCMEKLITRFLQDTKNMKGHTLNVTRDITRSMKDLEIDIVELERRVESTGDRGQIEALKSKKKVLADLLGTRITEQLLSKALANRLREVMDQVVHRDQAYCVPGRSIVDNVCLIRDVSEVSASLAFDRVEHQYLWKVMESFGFSAGLIAKIKVLYQDIESVLKFNGGLCAPFKVGRGIGQGCALSGMLYTISVEPVLKKIRTTLNGLPVPGVEKSMVLSAYADDIGVFINSQSEVL
ncbi:hypothetical protein NHX12_023913 [Muraenolepis orangiensis]|uniref:Reverse transcriptase domain-containing protein n=1 Tax=Muraenolepis orangiensis TaxID=630683 RepID=A0A9Q0EL75_9TELE|nr:hypothetical protein NHX12_023913 [Muraenolepis orangiensis]